MQLERIFIRNIRETLQKLTAAMGKSPHSGGLPLLSENGISLKSSHIFVRTNPAGNIKPDREKFTEKIAVAVAAIMELDRAIRNGGSTGSVYGERGLCPFSLMESMLYYWCA